MVKRILSLVFGVFFSFAYGTAVNPANVDLHTDLSIDIQDMMVFSAAWLSHGGPSDDWNPVCDLAKPADDVINQADFAVLCDSWLVRIPDPEDFTNPADINQDRKIDWLDYSTFSAAWLSDDSPSANWNPACDIAEPKDGVVDFNDLNVLFLNWLQTVPDPSLFTDVPDINQDRIVDFLDYSIFAAAWLSDIEPMPEWNPACDLDKPGDERVDGLDFVILAAHWGFIIPDPNQFVYIAGGQFSMGDHHDFMPSAMPVHAVKVDSFYMGRYEITNHQYCDYLNGVMASNQIKVEGGVVYDIDDAGSMYPYFDTHQVNSYIQIDYIGGVFSVRFKDGTTDMASYPLIGVSWYGAAAYCNWKSLQDGYDACYNPATWECDFAKRGYRLATEAQWEYAARGGAYMPYYRYPWGNTIDASRANYWPSRQGYDTGSLPSLTPVGYYDGNQIPAGADMANGFGLYDMAGNVLEWCNDWYGENYYDVSPIDNPVGPASGSLRVMRGGSWNNIETSCRAAFREDAHVPSHRSGSYGFRMVLAPLPMPD